ncbi:MAG: type III pantothenate kinase [Oscillospiraceae bacterium]
MRGLVFGMLLTVDIGNTNITLGIFDNENLIYVARLATEKYRTDDQYAIELLNIMALNSIKPTDINGAIISSVVPPLTDTIKSAIMKVSSVKAVVLAPGVKTGLNILIDDPAQLGADLAAGGVGAIAYYPLPCTVIDLGTATKLYVVDENSGFHGGVIAPGVAISLNALTSTSSLLPTISLNSPSKACGTNTVECMQSGSIFGTASMIDGLLDRLEKELGTPKSIVATGGFASCIIGECSHKIECDPDLLLKGLYQIYNKNTK